MKNKEKNFISAVLYVRNSEKEIRKFIKKVNKILSDNFLKYEIICVNDFSTDNSREEIKEAAKEIENTSITEINMSYFQGKEKSMNAGVDISIGDFVYEFDCLYMDYDEAVVMNVYRRALEGYDIVNASSLNNKRKSSKLFYKVFNIFSNNQYKIDSDDFRIISRRGINRIHTISESILYRKAIYSNCGLKMDTITYNSSRRDNNKIDRKEKKDRRKNAINSLILYTDISYKFSIIMSIIMMLITIIVAIYTISVFIRSNPIAGWTTTMLFLSFVSFGVFSIMAIIIKYLSIIIDIIHMKSKYIIESVEKLN